MCLEFDLVSFYYLECKNISSVNWNRDKRRVCSILFECPKQSIEQVLMTKGPFYDFTPFQLSGQPIFFSLQLPVQKLVLIDVVNI